MRDTVELSVADADRPRTREDCRDGVRPCPWVACKHNVYLNISTAGGIQLTFPDLEPWEVPAASSCALDVAERGGITLEEIGVVMNLTRERIRQVEVKGLIKLRRHGAPHPDGNDTVGNDTVGDDARDSGAIDVVDESDD